MGQMQSGTDNNGIVEAILNGTGLVNFEYDYVSVAYPTSTQEVYTFKSGGSGGTTVGTITIEYTDATKENLSSAERT
jgi:hypothetical protein